MPGLAESCRGPGITAASAHMLRGMESRESLCGGSVQVFGLLDGLVRSLCPPVDEVEVRLQPRLSPGGAGLQPGSLQAAQVLSCH